MGFTRLNGVYGTVATQSNSASTSVVLGSGQGAAFASATTTNPIRCAVIDTSTNPETLKFFLDVTGRSTDTLTVANRGVTDGNVTSADANILVGYTVAAVTSVAVLDGTYGRVGAHVENVAVANTTSFDAKIQAVAFALPTDLKAGAVLHLDVAILGNTMATNGAVFVGIGTSLASATSLADMGGGVSDSCRTNLRVTMQVRGTTDEVTMSKLDKSFTSGGAVQQTNMDQALSTVDLTAGQTLYVAIHWANSTAGACNATVRVASLRITNA